MILRVLVLPFRLAGSSRIRLRVMCLNTARLCAAALVRARGEHTDGAFLRSPCHSPFSEETPSEMRNRQPAAKTLRNPAYRFLAKRDCANPGSGKEDRTQLRGNQVPCAIVVR